MRVVLSKYIDMYGSIFAGISYVFGENNQN